MKPMTSADSVHPGPDGTVLNPLSLARVRVVALDPFGAFARAAMRVPPRRLTLVSPWVSADGSRPVTLRRLVEHADAHGSSIVLLTRPPSSEAHAQAVQAVCRARRGHVHFNPRLHAKLYVCESDVGRGLAVVGSANGTTNSSSLDEMAVLLRPERGSNIISELSGPTVRGLMDSRRLGR